VRVHSGRRVFVRSRIRAHLFGSDAAGSHRHRSDGTGDRRESGSARAVGVEAGSESVGGGSVERFEFCAIAPVLPPNDQKAGGQDAEQSDDDDDDEPPRQQRSVLRVGQSDAVAGHVEHRIIRLYKCIPQYERVNGLAARRQRELHTHSMTHNKEGSAGGSMGRAGGQGPYQRHSGW
jgi:hypothetical protein